MTILSLGEGWYDLETCKDGPFFWSSDEFSVYIETPILELELYFNCNKVKNEYKLKYSTDGWVTEHILNLESGINSLNVLIVGKKRIDFKCDYFIPSQIVSSSDNRKLGVQLIRALCNTSDNKCYELNINDLKPKFKIEQENFTGEINKDSFKVSLGSGWYDLEEESFRWSTGNGVLYIKDSSLKALKMNISSPINQKIIIRDNLNRTTETEIKTGNQYVYIKLTEEVKFIEIISEIYTCSVKENVTIDDRKLGIQLYSVDVSYENFDIKTFLVKNIFFEKDYLKLTNFLNDYNYESKLFNFSSDGHVKIQNFENKENSDGKFNLNDQTVFYTHRSGWAYAINSLESLHSDSGIKFEGFLERMFSWEKYKNIRTNVIPLKCPWVGFIHNPMFTEDNKPDLFPTSKLFNSIVFQKSLETCKGLYVLSNDLKEKIKDRVGDIPIEFCFHPTITPRNIFTLEKFKNNSDKRVISLGSLYRKILTIFMIQVPSEFKKTMIEPTSLNPEKFKHLLNLEKSELNLDSQMTDSVEVLPYQSSDEYDNLLSKNIMFMDFYDISASNLVIECIVRNTPILVKKHNAISDYLGAEYPFYFESIQEASDKINDESLIEKTHDYLTKLKIKPFLTGEYFLNSIKKGQIYNSL